jgi:hypothetical protein
MSSHGPTIVTGQSKPIILKENKYINKGKIIFLYYPFGKH